MIVSNSAIDFTRQICDQENKIQGRVDSGVFVRVSGLRYVTGTRYGKRRYVSESCFSHRSSCRLDEKQKIWAGNFLDDGSMVEEPLVIVIPSDSRRGIKRSENHS